MPKWLRLILDPVSQWKCPHQAIVEEGGQHRLLPTLKPESVYSKKLSFNLWKLLIQPTFSRRTVW